MKNEILDNDLLLSKLAKELPDWHLDETGIVRTINTTSWKSSLMIANMIGFLAENAWHHPDLLVKYSSVTVTLTTHSAGGVTLLDLHLAAEIDVSIDDAENPPEKHRLLK